MTCTTGRASRAGASWCGWWSRPPACLTGTWPGFLGERHGLAPDGVTPRLHAEQYALTILDHVLEVHDTHHPVGVGLFFEEQRDEAKRRAAYYLSQRLPKHLRYVESLLERRGGDRGPFFFGPRLTYPDLAQFQLLEGIEYAFPKASAALVHGSYPLQQALREAVRATPRVAAYLASGRRVGFNEDGIFRHYPELDGLG